MIKNIVSIESEVGLKRFALHCENDASLEHCLQAIKNFETYIVERMKQAEPKPEIKVEE